MPSFKKRALSLYLRNRCQKQFILYLYTDSERKKRNMPSRERRSGLGLIGKEGYKWQNEKTEELAIIFGKANVHENPEQDANGPKPIDLSVLLAELKPFQFIVEAQYDADTPSFRSAIGLENLTDFYGDPVDIGNTRPDVVQILPSMYETSNYGQSQNKDLNLYRFGIKPDGKTFQLDEADHRLRLRVIDIKLTSEPGAHYFAEVVYYSMTLAGWLQEHGHDQNFVVVAAPAIWPGSHEASELAKQTTVWRKQGYSPTSIEQFTVLEEDLEIAPVDVFAPRLNALLTKELPELLQTEWQDLDWHVDFRCKGCEFLHRSEKEQKEDPRSDLRCKPTAAVLDDLSRVAGLSRGGRKQLQVHDIDSAKKLAKLQPSEEIFDDHQGLRSKRTAYPHRAAALQNGQTSIIPDSGGDALMPKWPDLRIFLYLEYDLSSAITMSMTVLANWREPLPYQSALEPKTKFWIERQGEDEVFLVDSRKIERERAEFIKFLKQITKIIDEVRNFDTQDDADGRRDKKSRHSKYQIYLWDDSQKKHLIRVMSRHLSYVLSDRNLRDLAWIFPPPEILEHASEATRRSALTLVKNVVENTIAVQIPHHYGLLDLAKKVVPAHLPEPSVHPLYHESFSDLIPMERLHEYWQKSGRWRESQKNIVDASRQKVYSLSLIASWLQRNLQHVLSNEAAPPVTAINRTSHSMAPTSRLWLGFTELNAAVESLDVHTTRSMPPHERIARFKSAALERRLAQLERSDAISLLNKAENTQLSDTKALIIYELSQKSTEINIRRGEFLYALVPSQYPNFLDKKAISLTDGTQFQENWHYNVSVERAKLTQVEVLAIDRDNRLIGLRLSKPDLIKHLEDTGQFDFSSDVMLDPIHDDFLTKKVDATLWAIGHPQSATDNPELLQALGIKKKNKRKFDEETPASEILWNASIVAKQIQSNDVSALVKQLEQIWSEEAASLNESQWKALQVSITNKLSLIWGPPGTGKSRTIRAIIAAIVWNQNNGNAPIRILVTANTYTAIDNILLALSDELTSLVPPDKYSLYRLQSTFQESPPHEWTVDYPNLKPLVLDRYNPSNDVQELLKSLNSPDRILILGCPPQQLHNLAIGSSRVKNKADAKKTMRNWFDYTFIDEASQMDVATSTLIFSKRAKDGACVIAGDDKQLPPIHQATPPDGLEDYLGSLYSFFRDYHGIQPVSLDINYRSNSTIVEFTKNAGYSNKLKSYSPDLMLNLTSTNSNRPSNWPESLYWTPNWQRFLEPKFPAISCVYVDDLSPQVNDFEADATASLIWLLRQSMKTQLLNEKLPNGEYIQDNGEIYSPSGFWRRAIGVVTPHRAQRSRVINRLRQIFPNDNGTEIVEAVDTVERYQGQQRDVIIASFGIGDPDIVQSEDEFLFNLNRFNVLVSRARAKVIIFATESLLRHLSNDLVVLEESRLLKGFMETFCEDPQQIQVGYIKDKQKIKQEAILRRKK